MLLIDFETMSECDIKKSGANAYARHHSTSPLCLAFSLSGSPVKVWVPDSEVRRAMRIEGATYPITHELPQDVILHVATGGEVWAHNASFDVDIWNHTCEHWPAIDPEQIVDTMALGCAMALPASLSGLLEAMGAPLEKDKKGSMLIRKMSKPPFETSPTLLGDMINYCARDVEALIPIIPRLMLLSKSEREVWQVNYKANQRGIMLDNSLISECIRLSAEEDIVLGAMAQDVAGLSLSSLRSPAQILKWCLSQGVTLPNLSKDTLATANIENPLVLQVLELRSQVCKSSIKKFDAMLAVMCPDGRARGNHVFHRATTGRFAGAGVQIQNLPRPALDDPDGVADYVVEHGTLPDGLDVDTKTALSSLLRSCIIAPEGKEFYCADFSAIESRVLFWLADEQKGLDVYRRGDDLYCVTASGIYGRPISKKDKAERQIGKIAVLSLGYGGGPKAFQGMCDSFGIDTSAVDVPAVVKKYRDTFPKVCQFWWECESAAKGAIENLGQTFRAGKVLFKASARRKSLACKLPSGRLIQWPFAEIKEGETPWGAIAEQINFMGMNLAHKWSNKRTYAGDLAQSATQATARDMLTDAMLRVERAGFPVVLHVHDEIVVEMVSGLGRYDEFEALMSEPPVWAIKCPIAAEGWVGRRYQK